MPGRFKRIYFHLLDRQEDVVDIREQFPILHLQATQILCGEAGVRHCRKGRYPEPFTLDFLITRRTESGLTYQARSVKIPTDAEDPAIRLRLSIEQRWCQQNGIDWKLVDTRHFTNSLLSTLTFMRGWALQRYVPIPDQLDSFCEAFYATYERNRPLREGIEICARRLRRGYTQCLNDFRYGTWADRIQLDINQKLTLHLPVALRNV